MIINSEKNPMGKKKIIIYSSLRLIGNEFKDEDQREINSDP